MLKLFTQTALKRVKKCRVGGRGVGLVNDYHLAIIIRSWVNLFHEIDIQNAFPLGESFHF